MLSTRLAVCACLYTFMTVGEPPSWKLGVVARLGSNVDVDDLKVHGGRPGVLQAVGEGPVWKSVMNVSWFIMDFPSGVGSTLCYRSRCWWWWVQSRTRPWWWCSCQWTQWALVCSACWRWDCLLDKLSHLPDSHSLLLNATLAFSTRGGNLVLRFLNILKGERCK